MAGKIELLQGTLDMLILRTLQWGPQHGHGISVAIRATSEDALHVDHGSLYPALHRLREQGWIDAEWKMTEKAARALLPPHSCGQEGPHGGGIQLELFGGSHREGH